MDLYNNISKFSDDIAFEIIFVGPETVSFQLPLNFRYIQTGNIKVPQCHEIAMRNAQGDMITFISDDGRFWETGGLSHLYKEYEGLCDEKGHNRLVLFANRKQGSRVCDMLFSKAKTDTAPFVGLEGALYHRDLLSQTKGKGIDTRFLGTIWDSDLAMRFHEVGIEIIKSSRDIWCVEVKHEKIKSRLHAITNAHDIDILRSFWVREKIENEKIPSDTVWGYMQDNKYVLSRDRFKEFIGYKDENLLIVSQGTKSIKNIMWD